MDILKRASKSTEHCSVDEQLVTVLGRAYPSETPVEFPTSKSRAYSLGAVVFFLIHGGLSIGEYVTLCKQSGVPQVSYLDQASIREDIERFTASEVRGFFRVPAYTSHRHYVLPSLDDTYILLVSGDILSILNTASLPALLAGGPAVLGEDADGQMLGKSMGRSLGKSLSNSFIERNGSRFVFVDYAAAAGGSLEEDDWGRVKGAFLGDEQQAGSKYPGGSHRINGNSMALFSMTGTERGSVKLLMEDDRLVNKEEVWGHIQSYLDD